jgi:hypothetical protein
MDDKRKRFYRLRLTNKEVENMTGYCRSTVSYIMGNIMMLYEIPKTGFVTIFHFSMYTGIPVEMIKEYLRET